MMEVMIQGRLLNEKHIEWIRELMDSNPDWHRTRLSQEICAVWNWVAINGQFKDMACRTMLLKLERRGYLQLPARRTAGRNNAFIGHIPIEHSTTSIECVLQDLTPLSIEVVQSTETLRLFNHLLAKYHYLGFGSTIGENMKYIVYDCDRRPLACLLFGSAAWKVAGRDQEIGWNTKTRHDRLRLITNNTRYPNKNKIQTFQNKAV